MSERSERTIEHSEATTTARIVAVARRDLVHETSYHFALALRFAQMLFVTTTLYFVSKLVTDTPELAPYGGRYFEFVVVGIIVASFVTLGLGAFSRSITDEQKAGTLEMLLVSATPVRTLLAGSLVVPFGMTLLNVLVYLTMASTLFGADLPIGGLLLAVPVLVLTVATFCAFGIFSASFIVLTKRGDPFTLFAAQASTFLAGTIFPTTVLPGALEALTRFVPAYYGLEAIRSVLLSDAGFGDIVGEMVVLVAFAVVLLPLSLLAFSRALRAARVTGTLGNY